MPTFSATPENATRGLRRFQVHGAAAVADP
jgi:hypothetical protein